MTSEPDALLERQARNLVARVTRQIASSSGDRSTLRRALRREPDSIAARRVHAIIAPYVPTDAGATTERAFYTVASMIAAQPRTARDHAGDQRAQETDSAADTVAATPSPEPEPETTDKAERPRTSTARTGADRLGESLGATLGSAAAAGKLNPDTAVEHLHLLCRQQVGGIHRHLPRLILRLRAELVPVAWTRLLVDLAGWDTRRNTIAKAWLQDYYRTFDRIAAARQKAAADTHESENS